MLENQLRKKKRKKKYNAIIAAIATVSDIIF